MQRPPGRLLLALARRVLADRDLHAIVEPAIADLQYEWSASAGAALVARLAVRVRAYLAVLYLVGLRLFAASIRANLTPPPWPIVKRILGPSALMFVITAGVRLFVVPLRDADEHWLFFLPDWMFHHSVFLPLMWLSWFQKRPLELGDVPPPRARDLARLTVGMMAFGLLWAGWIAPLLRQQYLVSIGLTAWAETGPHQWFLPALVAALATGSSKWAIAFELHRRLIFVALIPIAGALTWSALVRGRGKASGKALGFQFLSGLVLMTVSFLLAQVFVSRLGFIPGEWMGVLAAAIGAGLIVKVAHVTARSEGSVEISA